MRQSRFAGPDYGFLPERRKAGRHLTLALVVGFSVLAGALSVAWYLTTTTPDFTYALSRVRAALAKVRSAESTLWLMHGGKRIFREKRYYDGGRWRIERADGEVQIFTVDSGCVRPPGTAKAVCFGFSEKDAPFSRPSYYLSLDDFDLLPPEPPINPVQEIAPPENAVVSSTFEHGGKACFRLTKGIERTPVRVVCIVDAHNYLPVSVELQQQVSPSEPWITVGGQEMDYKKLQPDLFDPRLLAPGVLDLASVRELPGRLNIISDKITGNVTATLFNAEVDSRGDLFVAYLGPPRYDFSATDEEGNAYLSAPLGAKIETSRPSVVQGEALIPVAAPLKPKNRIYTLKRSRFLEGSSSSETIIFSVNRAGINTFPPLGGPQFPVTRDEVMEEEARVLEPYYLSRAQSASSSRGSRSANLSHDAYLQALGLRRRLIDLTAIDVRLGDYERVNEMRLQYREEGRLLEQLHRTPEAAMAYRLAGFGDTVLTTPPRRIGGGG